MPGRPATSSSSTEGAREINFTAAPCLSRYRVPSRPSTSPSAFTLSPVCVDRTGIPTLVERFAVEITIGKTYAISGVIACRKQALVVSNSIGRDRLVGAEASRRRSRAVGFLLQVCTMLLPRERLECLFCEVGNNTVPAGTRHSSRCPQT